LTNDQQGTSSTVSLDFLSPKTTRKHEEVDDFLLSLDPEQIKEYNLLTGWGYKFDEIKTTLIQHKDIEFNKKGTPYLASLQQESGEHSMAQSSENSSAKKISVKKRPVKPSSRLHGKIKIPTFVPGDFKFMNKAKALHEYLFSEEGQEECGQ
jgi:hypothetical protein